jgi:hypothetical protein
MAASFLFIALDSLGLSSSFNKPEYKSDRLIFLDSFLKTFLQETAAAGFTDVAQFSGMNVSQIIGITGKATEQAIKDVIITHPQSFGGKLLKSLWEKGLIKNADDWMKNPYLQAINWTEKIVLLAILNDKKQDIMENYGVNKNVIIMIE